MECSRLAWLKNNVQFPDFNHESKLIHQLGIPRLAVGLLWVVAGVCCSTLSCSFSLHAHGKVMQLSKNSLFPIMDLKHTADDGSEHLWGPTKPGLLTFNVSGWNKLSNAVLCWNPTHLKYSRKKPHIQTTRTHLRVHYPHPITMKPLLAIEITWNRA